MPRCRRRTRVEKRAAATLALLGVVALGAIMSRCTDDTAAAAPAILGVDRAPATRPIEATATTAARSALYRRAIFVW